MKILITTNTKLLSLGVLLLRCTIGVILFIGGSGKAFGWFHGFGIDMTMHYYSLQGISKFLTYCNVYCEFIGGALLILGLLTRPAAFAIMINMLVAFIMTLPNGFVAMNGASYPFTFLICSVLILLTGPMLFSVDYLLARQKQVIATSYPGES